MLLDSYFATVVGPNGTMDNRDQIDFMGVSIDVVDTKGLYDRIIDFVREDKPHKVMYVNAHCMVVSQKDERYRNILNGADLVYSDGMSIVWGARLSGCYLPGRSTAADFMPRFFELFAEKGLKVFLLGAEPGVADDTARKLEYKNPGLRIVGTHHGYFGCEEHDKIIKKVNESSPHILMVGMGVPCQEKWIEQNCNRINAPVIWGVGALFDFLSGRLARGPQWLLDNGFEWLCRLLTEPRRLWHRYLVGNCLFTWYAIDWKFSKRNRP